MSGDEKIAGKCPHEYSRMNWRQLCQFLREMLKAMYVVLFRPVNDRRCWENTIIMGWIANLPREDGSLADQIEKPPFGLPRPVETDVPRDVSTDSLTPTRKPFPEADCSLAFSTRDATRFGSLTIPGSGPTSFIKRKGSRPDWTHASMHRPTK